MKKSGASCYIMLGRKVVHNSPARLSGYMPPPRDFEEEHEQIAAANEALLKPKDQDQSVSKNIGAAAAKLAKRQSFDPGGQTQTPAFKAYRAGEREAY